MADTEEITQQTDLIGRWGRPIYAAIGAICVIIWAIATGWPGAMTAVSYDQERLDTAIPSPQPEAPISFTFMPDHDGLTSIEVVVVNFRPDDADATGIATLTLSDETGAILASRRLAATTPHNRNIQLNFSPISKSSQKVLTLTMVGSADNHLSLWGYSLNVWPDSALSGGGGAQTLRAVTRYAYQWSSTPAVLSELFGRFWSVILVALLYIPLPGAIFFAFAKTGIKDYLIRFTLVFGLGIAIWPLVWQWLTTIGLSFSGPILWVLVAVGWGVVIFKKWQVGAMHHSLPATRKEFWLMVLSLILLFCLRLIAIRDMAFLPWVDSSRHALITAIMRDHGQFLTTYEPYLPISWSGYHYGFHTLSAGIALMLGDTVSLPDLLLPLMQLLSTLTTLSVFAGAVLLTGRRSVGWIAAFMLALPFLFPAYYTTWGRLTQISGMIVLPLIVGLLGRPFRFQKLERSFVMMAVILVAGLFLLHARVFFYFIPFGLVLGIFHSITLIRSMRNDGWSWQAVRSGPLAKLVVIALSAGVLVSPRIWRLLNETTYTGLGVVDGTSFPLLNFPVGYVMAGWELWFWWLAGGAVLLAIGNFFIGSNGEDEQEKSERLNWLYAAGLLTGWLGLLYLMTAGPALHPRWPILLPQSSVNSAYIAAFAAEAILIGIFVVLLYQIAHRLHRLGGLITIAVIGAALTAGALFGVKNQVVILNRATILGHQADLAAIEWISENTPPNAKVANNAWLWLGGTWAGTDGAAWLTPMTGRITGTPPIDHIYNSRVFGLTSAFNDAAKDVADWSDPPQLELLRQNRFTHIFTGVSDGSGAVDFDPAQLLQNPGVKVVFAADGVYVFEILEP